MGKNKEHLHLGNIDAVICKRGPKTTHPCKVFAVEENINNIK